jgi:tetratricopeptide (TPR) repeat protein
LKGDDLLRAVKQWIEQHTNWLLILDNADDLGIFKKIYSASQSLQTQGPELLRFVPKSQGGTAIWTSRDGGILGSIIDIGRGIKVGAMSKPESWKLFQRLSGSVDTEEPSENEDKLLELLQRLPLAIAQAAAYISKTKVSVPQYLKFFSESESRQSNLLSQEFQDVYRSDMPNSVMHTWRISMRQIAKESPCSEKILNTIAFFDNKGLPFKLLKAAAGPTFNEDEVLLAASRLIEYSFLQAQRSVDEGLPTYEQHHLVHLVTRRALTKIQICSLSGKALKIMTNLFPDGTQATWTSCKLYLPHALKVAMWVDAQGYNNRAPLLLLRVGRYYWEQGQSDEAERLVIKVLALGKEMLGEKHPTTIAAMSNLASTWGQQGRSNEAERLEVEVLALRKEILGEKHLDTILAMENLASTWRQQGRSDEAERLEVEVLTLRKEMLSEKHPDTIRAMAHLAATLWQQGRSDEANRLVAEVLALREKVLGEKHPDTITAMANLASAWWQQGRLDEAEQLEMEVLALRKEMLGEKHPDTITAMEYLALTWGKQGRSGEAERLEVEVLTLRKEMLGEGIRGGRNAASRSAEEGS